MMHVVPYRTVLNEERCACGAERKAMICECVSFLGRLCLAPLTDNEQHYEHVWPR